jgi:hypothetical protein
VAGDLLDRILGEIRERKRAAHAAYSGRPNGCGSNRTGRSSHHARGVATRCPSASSAVSRKPAPPSRTSTH